MYFATNPSKLRDDIGDGAVIGGDDLAQILGICHQVPRIRRRPRA